MAASPKLGMSLRVMSVSRLERVMINDMDFCSQEDDDEMSSICTRNTRASSSDWR